MKTKSMYIRMHGLRFFAFHGVMPQERRVGAYFIVDLRLQTDFLQAARMDDLKGTVSYAEVYEVVRREMEQPSQLLEHVIYCIAQRLFDAFPSVEQVEIALHKENPPMGAEAREIGVEATFSRE